MIDNDDARFSSFTRDLARRQRRPRSYPPSPLRPDALEQLCGGGVIIPPSTSSAMSWVDDLSEMDLGSESLDAIAEPDSSRS